VDYAAGKHDVTTWLDSCDAKAAKVWIKGAAGIAGFLAVAVFAEEPNLAVEVGMVGGLLLGSAELISYYADISTLDAIWIRDHWHIITMGPQ
jgi:hypothetical protein